MRPLSAVHLPAIRDTLVENSRREHRYVKGLVDVAPKDSEAWRLATARLWDTAGALANAGLWWITPDMTTLAWHTANHSDVLPDWNPADSAHRNGLMVFDGGVPLDLQLPLDPDENLAKIGLEPPPMRTVRLAAVTWHHTPDTVRLAFYTADPRMLTTGCVDGTWITPWAASAAPLVMVPHPRPNLALDLLALRLVAAALLISAEPTVATVRAASWSLDGPPKARGRVKEVPAVKVVALREILHPEHHDNGDGSGARTFTHRWIVQDHERTYWTGPGRTVETKKWIAPYVAGPANLPLIVKETVRVWRR